MTAIIRVINPNSNPDVTNSMLRALVPLQFSNGPLFDCVTLSNAPCGIESQEDVTKVEPLLANLIRNDQEAAAFIIGCYSDPGLALCREVSDRPVFGIAECAILTALALGSSFGVISILANSVSRHTRHLRERLLHPHCAGDRPLGLTVAQLADSKETFARMVRVGTILRDEDNADALILGCAGMAAYREKLEAVLKLPVIEPTQAAASMALSIVTMKSKNWTSSATQND